MARSLASANRQNVCRTPQCVFIGISVLLPVRVHADAVIDHPVIQQKDIKSATCLTCHPEKTLGKFVYPALEMRCSTRDWGAEMATAHREATHV